MGLAGFSLSIVFLQAAEEKKGKAKKAKKKAAKAAKGNSMLSIPIDNT